MLYQNILAEDEPFIARCSEVLNKFPEHRHADIEMHYLIKGEIDILLEKREFRVREGELVFIAPTVSHEVPEQRYGGQIRILTIIVGISFLKEHFDLFSGAVPHSPIFSLNDGSRNCRTLRSLLYETAKYSSGDRRDRLLVEGNLYKICYYLSEDFSETEGSMQKRQGFGSVENIDKALDLIYYDYRKPLTVESAAEITGYSKSNFCRIFKKITGKTFHAVLNSQRIEVAARLLSESSLPLSEIAELVGLCDSKKLCRLFKEIKGVTPGGFRKKTKI